MADEGPYTIAGAVATFIVLGLTAYGTFVDPWLKRQRRLKELRNPAVLYFVTRGEVHHQFDELVLPANAEVTVNIGIKPKIFFSTKKVLFGCGGEENEKPYAFEFTNEFVKVGLGGNASPETNPRHALLANMLYQIEEDRSWTVGTDFAWGFRVKTRAAGIYPAHVIFIGEEVEGIAPASIRVLDNPTRYAYMRCISPDHKNCIVSLSSVRELGDFFNAR